MLKFIQCATVIGLFGGIAVAVGFWGPKSASSQEEKSPPKVPNPKPDLELSKFMRKKLEASDQILEGLVNQDSSLVIKGAKVLEEMSAAEKWQVEKHVMYRVYSADFQQSVKKLREAAEKENFDGAALMWIDTTLKCIECHKIVRGTRVAK